MTCVNNEATAILMLLEGRKDVVFYYALFKKIFKFNDINFTEHPALRDIILGFGNRRVKILKRDKVEIAIIDCRGFDNLKRILEDIINRMLIGAINHINRMIIVGDLDRNPLESIRGKLSSLKLKINQVNSNEYLLEDINVYINILSQGLEGGRMTGELEDYVFLISKEQYDVKEEIINCIDRIINREIDSKEASVIYSALVVRDQGMEAFISHLLNEKDENELKSKMEDLVRSLKEILES